MALGVLWRLGARHMSQAASLTFDEGLRIGAKAPQIAGHRGEREFHLSFGGHAYSMLVFGKSGCEPCSELLEHAAVHPATSRMRLVYFSDTDDVTLAPEIAGAWEVYRFHHEKRSREQWRARVSPYFHVIDGSGRVVEKGIANLPEHLDRLFALDSPEQTAIPTPIGG